MKRLNFILLAMALLISSAAFSQGLPSLIYGNDKAVISGKLMNMPGVDSVQITYVSAVSDKRLSESAPVAADGTFSLAADVRVNQYVKLYIAESSLPRNEWKSASLILVPGMNVKLTADGKLMKPESKKKPWKVSGDYARLNADMLNYENEYQPMDVFKSINGTGLSSLKGKGVSEFCTMLKSLYDDGVARINADKRLSSEFKEYATAQLQIVYGVMLTNGSKTLKYANGGNGEYTFSKSDYQGLVEMNILKNNGSLYGMFGVLGFDLVDFVNEFCGQPLDYPDCSKELLAARKYMWSINECKVIEDCSQIAADAPHFEDMILAANNDLKNQLEALKNKTGFNIIELDENLAGEDVLKGIVEKYKGKPVLVDFWATWCGPCRAAMKTIIPVKEELWDKCAFVYVTGPSSPRATWNMTIPDIHGDHYYVTAAQWETLLKQFNSQGIPTYVVVDSEGNALNHYIGFPGVDVIREQLTNAMK